MSKQRTQRQEPSAATEPRPPRRERRPDEQPERITERPRELLNGEIPAPSAPAEPSDVSTTSEVSDA